ncbi:MAG: glycosyltransferase family 4 protein [Pseudomonadota bacterium]
MKALHQAGYAVDLASRYICYSKNSDNEILQERKSGAIQEAKRLVEQYQCIDVKERPQIWITYHPYCKAPDWIGPIVSNALGIPYVTVEAARTGQGGAEDLWASWREEAQRGIKQADLHLVFKPTDRAYLAELLGDQARLIDIQPFMNVDTGEIAPQSLPPSWNRTTTFVTTGMMRKGKKDKNFFMLADIFSGLERQDWKLVIVGGGPEEANIRAAFSKIEASHLHWTGQVEHAEVLGWMKACDAFVWPGWKEPIGMVYLEAQLMGLPVIAYKSMGVPLVVKDGLTGFLAPEENKASIRAALEKTLDNKALRQQMGVAAKKMVLEKHSIDAGSKQIKKALAIGL